MKKHVSISVLKSLSKALFKILKDKNLQEIDLKQSKDILTALQVLVPHYKKSFKTNDNDPLIVNYGEFERVELPLAYSNSSFWKKSDNFGLTDQGLREQVLIYGSMSSGASEALVGFSQELVRSEKGLICLDASKDISLYGRMFSFCYENDILDRLKYVQPYLCNGEDEYGETHSLNILSGMNHQQLSDWMVIVMKTWEESNPELFKELPSDYEIIISLLAESALIFNSQNKFLTLNGLNDCFDNQWFRKVKDFENKNKLTNSKIDREWLNLVPLEEQELEKSLALISKLWTEYLEPFVKKDSSLSANLADVHLLPSIKKRDILIISMPYLYPKSFSNMIGASIAQASKYLEDENENEVQSVLIARNYYSSFSPSMIRRLSSLRSSNIGVIWHTTTEKPDEEVFVHLPSTAVLMKWENAGLDGIYPEYQAKFLKNGISSARTLHHNECYMISKNDIPSVKMKINYPSFKTFRNHPSIFIAKSRKYETLEQIKKELNSKKSEENFTEQAYTLIRACLNNKKSGISLSWCQNTVSKIMGYSNWHHACAEISAKNKK